jgi:hypothetical protein
LHPVNRTIRPLPRRLILEEQKAAAGASAQIDQETERHRPMQFEE